MAQLCKYQTATNMEPPKYETPSNKLSNEPKCPVVPNGPASINIVHGSEEEEEELKKDKCIYNTIIVLSVCWFIAVVIRFIIFPL